MVQCGWCKDAKAVLKRPKTGALICKECFYEQFEDEIHQTIVSNKLFKRGERVAIAASGGKGWCYIYLKRSYICVFIGKGEGILVVSRQLTNTTAVSLSRFHRVGPCDDSSKPKVRLWIGPVPPFH